MIVSLGPELRNYLLNIVTGNKDRWFHRVERSEFSESGFWTDRLVLIRRKDTETSKTWKLVDVVDESVIDLENLKTTRSGKNLEFLDVAPDVLQTFQKADLVLVLDKHFLALAFNLQNELEKNYALSYPQSHREQLYPIFSENRIEFKKLTSCWNAISCVSHNARFSATQTTISTKDGVQLTELDTNPSFRSGIIMLGWAYDDSGIYLQFNPASYIVEGGFVTPAGFRLPQPIVKLKVPKE